MTPDITPAASSRRHPARVHNQRISPVAHFVAHAAQLTRHGKTKLFMDRQRTGIVMAITDDRQHLPPPGPFSHSAISRDSSALPIAAPRPSRIPRDRFLKRVTIGRTRPIEGGVAVADDGAAPQRHQPGQPVIADGFDPFTHFVNGRGDLFKGSAAIEHVPDIQRGDGVRIVGQRFTNF